MRQILITILRQIKTLAILRLFVQNCPTQFHTPPKLLELLHFYLKGYPYLRALSLCHYSE